MRRLFLLLLFCTTAFAGFAQCTNSTLFGSLTAPIVINGTATLNTLNPGEYTTANACVSGYVYKMTSTVATDYFTVCSGSFNGPVVANGVQPLNFTTPTSGTYYVHLNSNAACGTTLTAAAHNVTITLVEKSATPAGCFNTSQTSSSMTAPGVIGGTSTATLVTTGRYTVLSNVVSGNYYKITTPLATNYISVRSGSYKGTIVAAGTQPLSFVAPVGGTYYVHTNTDANCGTNNSYGDLTTTRIYPFCSGTPTLGSALTSNAGPVCPATSFTLSVNAAQEVSGVTYQWEVSTTGASGPFTAIAGKTEATASIAGQEQSSWYRLAGICTGSNQSAVSEAVYVSQQAAAACYCVPSYQYSNQFGYINSVQLGTINNITGRNAAAPNNYYSYTSAPAASQTTDLAQGSSQTINVSCGQTLNYVAAWIDYNADGDFTDAGEQLGANPNQFISNISFPFTVPATAVPGPTRLRVRGAYASMSMDPCNNLLGSYGETEDYTVNIVVPPACTGSEISYYADVDGDGFGDPTVTKIGCSSAPPDHFVTDNTDCNDKDATKHASFTFYTDQDSDGFGTGSLVSACAVDATTPPTGYSLNNTDCDDNDKLKWQSATLYLDNDGDGYDGGTTSICYGTIIPHGYSTTTLGSDCDDTQSSVLGAITLYRDNDHDGFGDPNSSRTACPNDPSAFSGYVTDSSDCDDTRWLYADADGDGVAGHTQVACGGSASAGPDCDDNNSNIQGPLTYFEDADGDGFGNPSSITTACSTTPDQGYVNNGADCNDDNELINPNTIWYLDNDNDGYYTGMGVTSCEAPLSGGYKYTGLLGGNDCNDGDATVWQSRTLHVDQDGDGYDAGTETVCYGALVATGYSLTTHGSDCNDTDNSVWRSGTFYADLDGDGYTAGTGKTICYGLTTPTGYETTQSSVPDCDDNNSELHTGGQFYVDADGDGYGTGTLQTVCYSGSGTPTGYSTDNTDCAPSDITKWQSASLYIDGDNDGYDGGSTSVCYGATIPQGYKTTTLGRDCNDGSAAVNLGAVEICGDGIDNNCDGIKDENCAVTYGLSINDVSINEGNKGRSNMTFTVTLNKAFTTKVTVQYKTQNETATAGSDYVTKSGTLTFKPGVTKQNVAIPIIGDKTTEPNETFSVVLSNPINAVLLNSTGAGTILNDDGLITTSTQAVDVNTVTPETTGKLKVRVLPNPSYTYFTLQMQSGSDKPLVVRTFDVLGRLVETKGNLPANGTLRLGGTYRPGAYFTEVLQGNNRVTLKLIKQGN